MQWTFSAAGTSASIAPSDPGSHWQHHDWHAFASGTFPTTGPQLNFQYSPDGPNVPDASSRWFAPAALQFTAGGDVYFEARFRKMRAVLAGTGGPIAVVAEIV